MSATSDLALAVAAGGWEKAEARGYSARLTPRLVRRAIAMLEAARVLVPADMRRFAAEGHGAGRGEPAPPAPEGGGTWAKVTTNGRVSVDVATLLDAKPGEYMHVYKDPDCWSVVIRKRS